MITKDNEPIYRKANGTYMMTRAGTGRLDYWCGFPDDPDGSHGEVEAYLVDHPEALIPEPTPPEPSTEEKAAARRAEIRAELALLDARAIRPLCAVAAGTATEEDLAAIREREVKAEALRAELGGVGP